MKAILSALKQPLVQFLFLGAVIFAVDRGVNAGKEDPRRILIDDAKYAEIAGIYQDNQGRAPSEQEMAALTIQWAQNEVLYREARLMGLDKGDEMIRQRLVLKLRNVLFNRVVTEAPTQEVLRAWFEENRDKYDKPETFDLEQFQVGDSDGEEKTIALAASLGDREPGEDWLSRRRRYTKRPLSNLEGLFGREGADRLARSADNEWVPVRSPAGWHLARITARHTGEPADFDSLRSRVGEEWKAQASQAELGKALRAIAEGYDIGVELTTPPQSWDEQRIRQVRLAIGSGES